MIDTDQNSDRPQLGRLLPSIEENAEINLRGLLQVVWRRKATIVSTVILLTMLSIIVLFQITPRYTSTALVVLDPRETQILDINSVVSGLPADTETIASEIEIIGSSGLAEKVIQKLTLYEDPEFNQRLRAESIWQSSGSALMGWIRTATAQSDEPSLAIEKQFDRERVGIIESFSNKLRVDRVGRSRVIQISFESESPRTAMLTANTVADLYLVEQLEANFEVTRRATRWLSDRLADLRDAVEISESAVEAYRKQAGLIEGTQASLTTQQISELSTQLVLSRSARAEAEARLRQVTNLVNSSDSVNSVAEVLASPLIQNLREQEAEVDRRIAELSNEYGAKHPRMINIRAEMTELQGKIAREVGKVVQNLRNEVSVARAREGSLSTSLKGLELRVAETGSSEIQLRALQREANADRELYETFLARYKETSAQEELQQADSRIIARAEIPSMPSFPRKSLIVLLVFIGSILLGVILAFAIEQLDHGFRSMAQIEQMTGLQSLGLVPMVKKGKGSPERFAVENPLSHLCEAIRTIYTALVLSNVGQPPKVVLVTSALPREGKTTIALLLGRICALLGKRTIIIDADLRRPQVHLRMDLPAAPGLVELLIGESTLAEAICHDEASGADIVPVGKTSPNASELLNSDRLENFLELISEDYDLVILDAPPTTAVADARVLTHLADATILVVRWAATRREIAAMAAKHINEAGGNIAGVVLSQVNVKQHATYGYGDSGIYYGSAQKYYSD